MERLTRGDRPDAEHGGYHPDTDALIAHTRSIPRRKAIPHVHAADIAALTRRVAEARQRAGGGES